MKEWLIGLTALVLIAVAYIHIPMEWRRQKDIEMGNKIIANIEQFQQKNGRLPANTEAELLPLGFHHNQQGWQPNFVPVGNNQYEIRFQDGYTPPFLTWRNREEGWVLVK
ncbi:hypothetical protein QDY71_01225 [Kingella negevensis]|uniref:Type II secretion system protein G n=1 Tax=Kingella negevensis TaxID=1522312 RepID=A0A238HFD0_9NEIS|nr:hypothetical protein [Kingella negevensis]MDK4680097.1 hypothetical protein [Kingella negevensis]MDK4682183.1 hypothetical protein [Kingella negevensis]MDK4684406.1 hypothetical protein [Kingella negevensis]MDK4690380.1 hypothetical protein [Kingella negevensis]MDK4692272.1 hypothetical protein [Kingella negevensis]